MTARFRIAPAPTLAPGAQRYSVACRYATTSMAWTPAELADLTPRQMVSVTLRHHEDECGRCNLARLWREHGDEAVKAEVDRLHDEIQERMVAKHLAGRRN